MFEATLTRFETGVQGTFGWLEVAGLRLATAEPPWKNNQEDVSCVPAGEYECLPRMSLKNGFCYELQDVPRRSEVQVHKGNYAGDTSKINQETGHLYVTDTLGCILVGLGHSVIEVERRQARQKGVASSGVAVEQLRQAVGEEGMFLAILWSEEMFKGA